MKLHRKILLANLTPLLLTAAAGTLVFRALTAELEGSRRIAEVDARIRTLHETLTSVVDAETGIRGFLLTGDALFLAPYETSLQTYPAALGRLSGLVPDDAGRHRLEEVGRLVAHWRTEYAGPAIASRRAAPPALLEATVRLEEALASEEGPAPAERALATILRFDLPPATRHRFDGVQQALAAVRAACPGNAATCLRAREAAEEAVHDAGTDVREDAALALDVEKARAGKELIDRVRAEIAALSDAAEADRTVLLATDDATAREARQLLAVVMPVVLLLGLLAAWLLGRSASRGAAELARIAGVLGKGDLSQRAAVGGSDELGEVGEAMNAMAGRLATRERESAVLARLSDTLQACVDLAEAWRILPTLALDLFPGLSGELLLTNASRNLLETVARFGPRSVGAATALPQECWALRRGRPWTLERPDEALACAHHAGHPGPCLCIPLLAHEETLGVLTLRPDAAGAPLPEVELFARTVAEQLALALANLRLRETLRYQAIRDPLTGLYNRRFLEEMSDRELARIGSKGAGLLLFDVDLFKRFNDTHGHDAGDTVLTHLGELLRSVVTARDVPCRFGGEEFAVLLPHRDPEETLAFAENLRRAVSERAFVHAGRPLGTVTISIGAALAPVNGLTRADLLKAADLALYEAKKAGRNVVRAAFPAGGQASTGT